MRSIKVRPGPCFCFSSTAVAFGFFFGTAESALVVNRPFSLSRRESWVPGPENGPAFVPEDTPETKLVWLDGTTATPYTTSKRKEWDGPATPPPAPPAMFTWTGPTRAPSKESSDALETSYGIPLFAQFEVPEMSSETSPGVENVRSEISPEVEPSPEWIDEVPVQPVLSLLDSEPTVGLGLSRLMADNMDLQESPEFAVGLEFPESTDEFTIQDSRDAVLNYLGSSVEPEFEGPSRTASPSQVPYLAVSYTTGSMWGNPEPSVEPFEATLLRSSSITPDTYDDASQRAEPATSPEVSGPPNRLSNSLGTDLLLAATPETLSELAPNVDTVFFVEQQDGNSPEYTTENFAKEAEPSSEVVEMRSSDMLDPPEADFVTSTAKRFERSAEPSAEPSIEVEEMRGNELLFDSSASSDQIYAAVVTPEMEMYASTDASDDGATSAEPSNEGEQYVADGSSAETDGPWYKESRVGSTTATGSVPRATNMTGLEDSSTSATEEPEATTEGFGSPKALAADAREAKLLEEALCFPPSATVELLGGSIIQMEDVVVGDVVRVGRNMFSRVFMFTHKMAATTNHFVSLKTGAAEIELTSGHYIYVNGALATASTVNVGDFLTLATGEASTVEAVGSSIRVGLYNPQTVSGDIVVSGVLASTYTAAVEPSLAHALLAPFRALSAFGWTFAKLESGAHTPRLLASLGIVL